tara:strand:- start:396 stop:728 length:333 start_codon:yes stop_codon:yes gene_type:complete
MKRSTLYWIVGISVVGAATIIGSRMLGEQAGSKSLARLELVWPSFDSMAKQDKGILAGYALTCQLDQVELEKAAVIECLSAAANEPEPLLPKGITASQAKAKYEQLIHKY